MVQKAPPPVVGMASLPHSNGFSGSDPRAGEQAESPGIQLVSQGAGPPTSSSPPAAHRHCPRQETVTDAGTQARGIPPGPAEVLVTSSHSYGALCGLGFSFKVCGQV